MTMWFVTAGALLIALIPCGVVCFRARLEEAVVALELAGLIAGLALLILSEALRREPFADLALVLLVCSFAGSLFLARFLEGSE
jgi:multicomponent Na+:H+ antiporter subunit F